MQELGVPADDLFESIDEEPLGAASIGQVHLLWRYLLWPYLLGVNTLRPAPSSCGQVHRATLHGGQEVVVKVQYPNAKRYFATDMTTLTRFCRAFYPEVAPP